MNGPIVSIDVSNGSSHFQCFLAQDKKYGKVHKINHDVEGFQFLLDSIKALEAKSREKVSVVYEATGVYTKPLQRWLEENHIPHHMISPLASAKQRQTKIHGKKTDKADPKYIAAVYYSNELRAYQTEEEIYHNLRMYNRSYEDSLNHLRKRKVTVQDSISIVFPGFLKLFKDAYCDIALCILEKYPHPDMLKNKKPETVAKYIEKHTCHKQSASLKWAEKVIEFANKTYAGCDKNDVEVEIFLNELEELKDCMQECDEKLHRIIDLAATLPNYHVILSIDGIGPNLAARILAEIGDINRFKTKAQLVAYVGLDPNIGQSGAVDGDHLSISKKGNKHLRCLLYLAVCCNLRLNKPESPIREFYQKKKQQPLPLKDAAAKIACTNKLLRIIYAMCKSGTMYLS